MASLRQPIHSLADRQPSYDLAWNLQIQELKVDIQIRKTGGHGSSSRRRFFSRNMRVWHAKEKRKLPWKRRSPLDAGVMMYKGHDRAGP